jgi:predicted transport protein
VPSADKAANLIAAWRTAYPKAPGARFLEKHSDFCRVLTQGILALGADIEISFDPRSVIFSDGPHRKRSFFGITPQFSQVLLAPLTLEVADILDLGLHAGQVRDVSNKKYKMGGLFRVEMAQELEMEVALELARRSFASDRNIETWNLRRISRE